MGATVTHAEDQHVLTDTNGEFEVPESPPRPSGERCQFQYLKFSHPACQNDGWEPAIAESGETANVDFSLSCCRPLSAIRIVGQVVDSQTQQPLEGIELRGTRLPPFQQSADGPEFDISGRSGADGFFAATYVGTTPAPRAEMGMKDRIGRSHSFSCGETKFVAVRGQCRRFAFSVDLAGETNEIDVGKIPIAPCP